MNINVTKIALYVVLIVLILFCGKQFLDRYSALMSTEVSSDPYEAAEMFKPQPAPVSPGVEVSTNTAEGTTSEASVETASDSTAIAVSPETSTPSSDAKEAAGSPPPELALTKSALDRPDAPDVSGIGLYVVSLFGLILGLGVMAAHDVSTFLGQRAHKMLDNQDAEGMHSAAYDAAEEVWAKGEYLEAIRMMREYLEKNPREVHVMIRIAEIYEKDLGNYLAAALEYEELLQRKLPRERWGWAAIHLVNLYFGKIDKPKEGLDLLYRIHREYGHTAAAEKARKRLLQLDPGFQAELDHWEAEQSRGELDEYESEAPDESAASSAFHVEEEPDSNLPKGFRKKK